MPQHQEQVDALRAALRTFLDAYEGPEIIQQDAAGTQFFDGPAYAVYTGSPAYLLYTTQFHDDPHIAEFIDLLLAHSQPDTDCIDVGCESGMTGLLLAHAGRRVTFHDFEGLGLAFIRAYAAQHPELTIRVIPYGLDVPQHALAVALDVLEHTGSHTGTLRWLAELGRNVALTYPCLPYRPPYEHHIDEYVDDEAVIQIAKQRYSVTLDILANGRRFMIYH